MKPDPKPDVESGERVAPRDAPLTGTVVGGRYAVLDLLGSGGMADVYEVEHRELGRRLALKVLRGDGARDSVLRGRFEREARTVAKLESEHIVAILDCGRTERDEPYFVMERLRGQDLRALLERDAVLSVPRAVQLATHVCRALILAHAAGVVHRDLKPENLFLVPTGSGEELCKVLDFGVAKLTGENPTLPGTLLGTARYMAPEQIRDGAAVGPATDVFALGVILFECLSGVPPFSADTLERVLFKILSEPAPSLAELRPELPASLVRLVERMLDKDPAARPCSARELMAELEPHLPSRAWEGATLQSTAVELRHVVARPRPSRARSVAVFALGAALGAGAVWVLPSSAPQVAPVAPTASATAPPPSSTPEPVPPAPRTLPSAAAPAPPLRPVTRASSAPAPRTSSAPPVEEKPPLFFPSDH